MTFAPITAAAPRSTGADPAPELKIAELTDSTAVAQYIADGCLVDAPLGRVGLELEAHCHDPAAPHRRPGWDEIAAVLDGLPALPGGSRITVEPGGAVELSGPPADGVLPAIEAMRRDQAVLQPAFAEAGLGLVFLGADPLRPPPAHQPRRPLPRHGKVLRHQPLRGSGRGDDDVHRIDPGQRRRRAPRGLGGSGSAGACLGAHHIAITANSPMLGGDFTGWVSSRQRVWGQMDSARCGPILGASGDDPGTDWGRYALKAPVMLVHTPGAEAVTQWVPFADWVDGRVLLGDRRPSVADLEYHLTTLFPPVRPRQWLEIRYLDSVPDALWPAVVFTLVALLDDPTAADAAAEAVAPVATAWDIAARLGLRDRRLYAAANACVAIAAERAPAELGDAMQRLVGLVEQGRCPGDDFADRVIEHGVAAEVSRAARGGL